jgi:hypothetical protein
MFQPKIFLIDACALRQPVFKLACGFDDIHAGNDSGAEKRKSNIENGESERQKQRRKVLIFSARFAV